MFQLIQEDNVFESTEQKLKEEVTYYVGLAGPLNDKEAMYEVDIFTDTEEPETDQYDSEVSSDVFIGIAIEGDFVDYKETFIKV